jgi:hypothetical protein
MLYAVLANFVGGIGIQYSLIIKDFGFNVMQTTLLNIPSGACMIIVVTFSMWMLRKFPVRLTFFCTCSLILTFSYRMLVDGSQFCRTFPLSSRLSS